jgi:hypothetical protein
MFASLPSWFLALVEKFTTQGLTAAAALAAASLGPIATIVIGRRQVRANVVSVNRQAWINALREDVAELMEKRIEWALLFAPHADGQYIICLDEGKSNEIFERIRFLGYRIELRLHPGEPKHDKLIALLEQTPAPRANEKLTAEIGAHARPFRDINAADAYPHQQGFLPIQSCPGAAGRSASDHRR